MAESKKKLYRRLGIILFIAGSLVGLVLFVLLNWAYFEAYFYFGYAAPADKTLTSLHCPLLMTTSDQGEVSIRISNDSDRDLEPPVRIELSYMGAATSDKVGYALKAGETRLINWPVSSEQMVFGHLVMARAYVYRVYTLPSYVDTCGTVMLDLPGLSGTAVFVIAMLFITACMSAGWALWLMGTRPTKTEWLVMTRAMVLFTIAVVLGLLGGLLGWWGMGLLCTIACLLLIFTVGGYYIQKVS
jgi:hypothetical protein